MTNWKPIESAPRDRRIWVGRHGCTSVYAKWSGMGQRWHDQDARTFPYIPTHWTEDIAPFYTPAPEPVRSTEDQLASFRLLLEAYRDTIEHQGSRMGGIELQLGNDERRLDKLELPSVDYGWLIDRLGERIAELERPALKPATPTVPYCATSDDVPHSVVEAMMDSAGINVNHPNWWTPSIFRNMYRAAQQAAIATQAEEGEL